MNRAWVAAVVFLAGCAPRPGNLAVDKPGTIEARREVWSALQPLAAERGLDPGFVYALVKIESDFDASAEHGDARGLLQIKPRAWKAVSDLPYSSAVWDWRRNLEVGMDAIAVLKKRLEAKGVFSYGLLWCAYHYGWDYVEARAFDRSRIPRPANPVAFRLYSGDPHPLAPPP